MIPYPPEDVAAMQAALGLARRGLGRTWPNPAVGCVIRRDGVILGRGWTQPGGRPHAEQVALAQARDRWGAEALRGAEAFVTLEPCAHQGKTPPCADALAEAGLARVVAPFADPDPRVNGRGFARLRDAGARIDVGLLEAEARAVNAGFLSRLSLGRPFLTLKMAATLDGRIATEQGESRWITGPQARARVHLMRAQSDAVIIGAATATTDDPMLDVRLDGLTHRSPVRIVADGRLTLDPASRLVRSAAVRPLWILHGMAADPTRAAALTAAGADLIAVGGGQDAGLNLAEALQVLGTRGLTRLLCEGGGRLAASILRARLADEVCWFTAGAAIGVEGAPSIAAMNLVRLADAPRLRLVETELLGNDVLTVWRHERIAALAAGDASL
jgi:diaminohydroxyphosphoribosylaminopyrimidine deaminase/5-amino-6-(5-phosphoribosylamino)uracil reductase